EGEASVTLRVTDEAERYAEAEFAIKLPGSPIPILGTSSFVRDVTTGHWEQVVTLSSNSDRPMIGVRIIVDGLPESVRIVNAAGVTDEGYVIVHGETVHRDQGREFMIQYEAPLELEMF